VVSGLTLCSCYVRIVEWGELSFKVVRLARAGNLIVAQAAFDVAVLLWQTARIELRQGARVIRSSKQD
jgi:hypothetical protein